MKTKLSARSLKAIKPAAKAFEVVDTELKGFLLRVQPTGRMTFYYTYRSDAGTRKRIKIGVLGSQLSVQQARDIAIQHAADVVAGTDIQASKQKNKQIAVEAKSKTLGIFLTEHYQPWSLGNLKSGQSTVRQIEYSFPALLPQPMSLISVKYIENWRTEKLKNGLKPSTLNRCVSALRAVLTKAVDWEVIEEHPLRKLKALHVDNAPKVRYLSEDEEIRLFNALAQRDQDLKDARTRGNDHRRKRGYELIPDISHLSYADRMTPLVTLSLKTGMRRGELFDLEWSNIDFNQNVITVTGETAKSKKTRHIPLSPIALVAINNWKRQVPNPSGRIFPADDGGRLDNVNTAWANILKSAEITAFRWHDMRHDFASTLVMKGVPLNIVRELCGHSDLNTTLRYAHLAPDHRADAIALIG